MELPGALIGFAILLGALALADEVLYRNRAETTRLELERGLVQSQLRSLRLQLQPHFLFNALNTIAAQVHVDAALADHLIGRLADLLRVSLRSTEGLVVPLHEELALLNAYADLMRARFGTRFCLEVQASTQTLDTPVPPLLLQPLVENAVRHGRLERDGIGHITVVAERTASHLVLTVHDDGPGIVAGRDPFTAGTGLSVTARRLALMFGDAAQITAANAAGGGFAVTMHVPSR
jgi:LytS/YehU family sensor histidine kinase